MLSRVCGELFRDGAGVVECLRNVQEARVLVMGFQGGLSAELATIQLRAAAYEPIADGRRFTRVRTVPLYAAHANLKGDCLGGCLLNYRAVVPGVEQLTQSLREALERAGGR